MNHEDIEQVRRVWWSLATVGARMPAEKGVIVIDGGRGPVECNGYLPKGYRVWQTAWGDYALDAPSRMGGPPVVYAFYKTEAQAFDAALTASLRATFAEPENPRPPGGGSAA